MNALRDDPGQRREAGLWLDKAAVDLQAVRVLLDRDPPLIDPASFHCQPGAEKIAKCLLVASGREAPHIHDIATLGRRVRDVFPDIGLSIEAVSDVTAWYFSARYPDVPFDSAPSLADIEDALRKLQDLHQQASLLVSKPR